VLLCEVVVDWCRAQALEVTRSRAYQKNDQALVEQKNEVEAFVRDMPAPDTQRLALARALREANARLRQERGRAGERGDPGSRPRER